MAEPTDFAASPSGIALPAGDACPLLALDLAAEVGPSAAAATQARDAPAGGRCTATSPAPSISAGQRRLVCEVVAHLDCPRYVRAAKSGRGPVAGRVGRVPAALPAAAAVGVARPAAPAADAGADGPPTLTDDEPGSGRQATEPDPATAPVAAVPVVGLAAEPAPGPAPETVPAPVRPLTRSSGRSGARPAGSRPLPIVIAGTILVICLVIAFVFTSLRGGLALPGATPGPDASAGVAVTSTSPTEAATAVPSPSSATPTPPPSPTPLESLTPSAAASPTPTASLPAAYAGLKPCPDRSRCYLYRIRSGDSLTKVADRLGVTLAAIKAINPKITDPSLIHVGDIIRVPLPKG